MRVPGVSAVADGDERHDASPDTGAAAPERRVVTAPDTRDDHSDQPAAPTMIASLCTSSRLPDRHTVVCSPRSHDRLPQTIPRASESGLALTLLLASLKSRLYGGAA